MAVARDCVSDCRNHWVFLIRKAVRIPGHDTQTNQGFWTPIIPPILCNEGGAPKDSVSTPFEFCVRLLRACYRPGVEEWSHTEEAAREKIKTIIRAQGAPGLPWVY